MLPSKVQTIESRQIAEMMGREHCELLKDIRKYSGYLAEGKIPLCDFFLESQYLDGNQRSRPCYQITKKGCEFLAHKMTGEKGAVFTAKYINRFHEMESTLQQGEDLSAMIRQILCQQEALLMQMQKLSGHQPLIPCTDMESLIEGQKNSIKPQLKVLTFPIEIQKIIDTLLMQKSRNFSYIARVCTAKGYRISSVSIGMYYRTKFEGGSEIC